MVGTTCHTLVQFFKLGVINEVSELYFALVTVCLPQSAADRTTVTETYRLQVLRC
jgi:hypothetical protein